jgi:predicted MFS family arabinose efflux permease
MARLRTDGWATVVALAVLASAGLLYLILLPLFVDQLQRSFGLSPAQAGLVTSVNAYAGVASAFATAPFVLRLPWRRTVVAALTVLAVCDLATPAVPQLAPLLCVRVLHGVASGIATAMTAALLGRTRLPDRAYAVLLIYQALVGTAALFVLPEVIASHGRSVLFIALAAGALAGVLAVLPLPDLPARQPELSAVGSHAAQRWTVATALAGVYLFQTFHTFLVAYALNIGDGLGLPRAITTSGVATGQSVGVLGSVAVLGIGARFGRVRPLLLIAPAIAIEALLLLGSAASAQTWYAAQTVDNLLTFFALPLLLGACAAAGRDGRTAVWGGLASKVGVATGPMLGGALLGTAGVKPLIVASCAGILAAGASAVFAARTLARRSRDHSVTRAADPDATQPGSNVIEVEV